VKQSSRLNSKQIGAVAGIWKRLTFYSASVIARVKRLRRIKITSGVEGDDIWIAIAWVGQLAKLIRLII
jgi:hypothetical protein